MAALPQCIQSAKELYDLRSRYKDASILITAIYSESMVIAASLSQVQNLLQHDALQSKPQLLLTFDRALTGCRVVYGCLEEEVRDLVAKAEADDLKFKDRAKFLWKEDTFKELLTQIRGQQSALSLLIQGLQMESIADIRKLVEENSVTLDQVVKRSRTLRQTHPRVRVPDSLFNHEKQSEDGVDADSIIKSAEFTFDDEVINSRAYRRAMALYTSNVEAKEPAGSDAEDEQDQPPAYESPSQDICDETKTSPTTSKVLPEVDSPTKDAAEEADTKSPLSVESPAVNIHQDAFDSIEKDYLPYMPRITSTAPHLSSLRANTSSEITAQSIESQAQAPTRSYSEGNLLPEEELAPPLPPRRPSGPQLRLEESNTGASKVRSASSDDSIDTSDSPSMFSNISATSSRTVYESPEHSVVISRKPLRKQLPLTHQVSQDILGVTRTISSTFESPVSASSLQNAEMHDIWLSLVDAEQNFVDRMSKFRKMFYDNVLRQWPLLEQHLEAIVVGEQLANINKEFLLQSMVQQVKEAEGSICDPSVFEQWTNKAHKIYREYCQRMPHAASSLCTTQMMDPKFGPFVNTVGLSIAWFGMGWADYLKLPISQLELYCTKLQSLVDIAESLDEPAAFHETARLKRAVAAVQWLRTLSSTLLEAAQGREDVQNLEKRIHTLDSNFLSQLRLLDSPRRVIHQGSMAMRLKSQGPWQAVHVMLLDNFLLWGKAKQRKKNKGEKIVVLEAPIAIEDLEVITPCEQHQFQKATMFDDIPRGSVVYPITVKSRIAKTKPHMLGALGFQEQKVWLEHFTAALNGHKANT
jgi:hypothetical protein